MANAIWNCHEEWAESLRSPLNPSLLPLSAQTDPAFVGSGSLLATDQGVRGILQVTNDMCYVAAIGLELPYALPDELMTDEASLSTEGVSLALDDSGAVQSPNIWMVFRPSWHDLTGDHRRPSMLTTRNARSRWPTRAAEDTGS